MRLSQKITGFLHNGVSTLWYFAVMAVKENFRNYVGRAGRTEGALSDELALLANGPSLADELPRLLAGARAGCDFLAIRGGTGASVANVSKVYFSSNMFLNTKLSSVCGQPTTSSPIRSSSAQARNATAWQHSTARSRAR